MVEVTITGLPELRAKLAQFSDKRFAAAVATALTRTAVKVRHEVQAEAQRSLDKPTPYTMRQLRYVAATAAKPVAAVGFNVAAIQDAFGRVLRYEDLGPGNTSADRYLTPNITGGGRGYKRLEVALKAAGALPDGWYVVPGEGAPRDAYGNVSRGLVVQVLSQLRIQLVAGSDRNMSFNARRQIAAQRKAGGRFFVIPPGGRIQPGVYQREFIGRGVTPIFIFVRSANYRSRFDFWGVAKRQAAAVLPQEIQRAVGEHIARLTARSGGVA
ncbi:MAG TPA: hypothetical protein PKA84_01640 [Rubrivivax sp.]|nr:hypothetical protein [Rubrivivax sp.]HMR68910.1 hypothetical protein [Rubrivivax sp.]